MVLDLRIPQNQRYQQIVLDTAVPSSWPGRLTRDQAISEIEQGWEKITEERADDQKAAYKASARRDASSAGCPVGAEPAVAAGGGQPLAGSGRAAGAGRVHSARGADRVAMSIFPLLVSLYVACRA